MHWEKIQHWISEHPYATGGIVFVVGLFLLWWFGFFGGSSSSSGSSDVQSYYAAEAAAAQAAGQTQQAQIAANAQDAQVQAAQAVGLAQIQAQQDVSNTQSADSLAAVQAQTAYLTAASAAAADVANQQTAAAVNIAGINANASQNIASTVTAGQVADTGVTAAASDYTNLIGFLGAQVAATGSYVNPEPALLTPTGSGPISPSPQHVGAVSSGQITVAQQKKALAKVFPNLTFGNATSKQVKQAVRKVYG